MNKYHIFFSFFLLHCDRLFNIICLNYVSTQLIFSYLAIIQNIHKFKRSFIEGVNLTLYFLKELTFNSPMKGTKLPRCRPFLYKSVNKKPNSEHWRKNPSDFYGINYFLTTLWKSYSPLSRFLKFCIYMYQVVHHSVFYFVLLIKEITNFQY